MSPVLAGLAVAIGVPILLFYVYGVVPVSLCRAGCGEGTRFEFDEEEDNGSRNHGLYHKPTTKVRKIAVLSNFISYRRHQCRRRVTDRSDQHRRGQPECGQRKSPGREQSALQLWRRHEPVDAGIDDGAGR